MNQKFKYLIDRWEGLNTYNSNRDLKPSEASDFKNLEIKEGKITLPLYYTTVLDNNTTTARWFKLWADTNDDWHILLAGINGSDTDLYKSNGMGGSLSDTGTLFSADKTSQPCAYGTSGILRIGGSLTNTPKYLRYWVATERWGTVTSDEYTERAAGIYLDDARIMPPSNSIISSITYTDQGSGYDFVDGDVVQYAYSFIYDNAQESLLYIYSTTSTPNVGQRVKIDLQFETSLINWRVTHINIYRSLNEGDFYYLTSIHIEDGELNSSNTWTSYVPTPDFLALITVYDTGKVLTDSYTARTGFADYDSSVKENKLEANFSACTICQGRTVIGNVKRYVGSGQVTYNDRLYFSPLGRYDSFYKNDWIDLETGDGDHIIAIENWGSDVIVFKSNHIYVFNMGSVSELNWTMKQNFTGYGINYEYNIVKTPYGIFFNKMGGMLYLYDGGIEIKEVSKKIRNMFIDASGALGYDLVNRHILVGVGSDWFYKISTDDNAISKIGLYAGGVNAYHFQNYISGIIYQLRNNDIVRINYGTPSWSITYTTGYINFDTERYKRIFKIVLRYKSDGVDASFKINGTTIGTITDSSNVWTHQEFYPNVYAQEFQFSITSNSGMSNFDLDSIEIYGKIYRT